jgi:hypothetical protein
VRFWRCEVDEVLLLDGDVQLRQTVGTEAFSHLSQPVQPASARQPCSLKPLWPKLPFVTKLRYQLEESVPSVRTKGPT